jgi:hypothetical protein
MKRKRRVHAETRRRRDEEYEQQLCVANQRFDASLREVL